MIMSQKELREWRKELDKSLLREAEETIDKIVAKYPKTRRVWNQLRKDAYTSAQWDMSDYIVVTKMNYNAHGDIHAKVVTANALKMLDLLIDAKVKPDIIDAFQQTSLTGNPIESGDLDDAHLIVLLSGLLHDIGNQVTRSNHNVYSMTLSAPILDEVLTPIYSDKRKRGIIRGFILHSIYAHVEDTQCYTIEGSLIKVADGTDMSKGRGRVPYDLGNVNIHTVSAMSIGIVEIAKGREKPIGITINMTNSAGVFQVEEILYEKTASGVIGKYVEISAKTIPEAPPLDERIVYKVTVEHGRFIHTK